MKTSKRLLSILLMLTMLLSMFTVMASADGAEDAPATHEHTLQTLEKVDEKPATCVAAGVKEHYRCTVEGCGKLFKMNDDGTLEEVTRADLDIPKNSKHQNNGLQPAKKATCMTPKKLSHFHCTLCGLYWYYPEGDSTGKGTYNEADLYVGQPDPNAHELTRTPEKPATCTENGTKAYWTCSDCHKSFEDEAGTKEIKNLDTWKVVLKLGHKLKKVEAKAATCTEKGKNEYYHCEACGLNFADQDGKNKIDNIDAWGVTPVLNHDLTHHPRAEATVDEAGNIEYWTCDRCGKYFDDAKGTHEISETETEIPMIPSYTLTVEVEKIATKTPGKVTYNGEKIGSLPKQIKGAEITLKAEAYKGYQFKKWVIEGTGAKVSNETAATTTVTIGTANAKITAVFEEKPMTELEVQVFGSSHGEVYYRYNKEDSEKLKTTSKTWDMDATTDKVKFWVYPDSGYKAVLQFNDGRKVTYTYGDSVEIDHYDLEGEDGVLSISFVKKSSSDVDDYPTLTFDITGGKHGTVYRGSREYVNGDVISIKKNDKMTFKAKADKGYVAVWTYKGDTYVGDEYTVKMGANDAKLYVEFMDKDDIRLTELPFRDVSKRDWYYDDVVYVYRKGYMDGMSSTRFGGELNTTRGQIVTILWRLTGEPRATRRNPFTDVSSSQYYYDAISWAYDAGVVDGFDARTFKPDQNVTREQLAAILYRYAKYMNLSTSGSAYLSKYRDADKIANWAYDAMAWANYRGLINGTSATRIDPKGYATRAQIAAILHRFAVEFGA